MASFLALKLTCMALVCMMVGAPLAHAISCGQVATYMAPCITYLRTGGTIPSGCCNGLRGLNTSAATTTDRQTVCRCLISAANNLPGLNPYLASGLPAACGLSLPYKFSTSTNCNSIK
ncbi:non-specific lipid-transfer protein 1 [Morus notabilis]|uniref:non-specific lipid-transfer protein 1 n=1 Tax=Morus notabilis TaxID=981085 RepID=UPI000CED120A|nr:non-specific lipid-transfer protein 1 [Morus notabilis]